MALTAEILTANESLAGLTEEQRNTIVTLSQNDEDRVVGERVGDIYRRMDTTIEQATGVKRDGDEKTYNYLARATKEFSGRYADYDSIKGQVETLTKEKAGLEERLAKGGDDALKAQYEAVKNELATTKVQYTELKAEKDALESKHASEMNAYKIDTEITKARGELKLKSGMNQYAQDALIGQAIANVKKMNPSFEERNGVQTLVFHNADGSVMNNTKNSLNPYTAKELLEQQFRDMDLLESTPRGGAGGKQVDPKVPITATTKVEAEEIITKTLTEKGLVRGTSAFQEEFKKMWKEGGVDNLPFK